MTRYFSGLRFGAGVGALASFGVPIVAADAFVREFMDKHSAGLSNALSMAYRASMGLFGSSRQAYLWYMSRSLADSGYDRSFFRYGVNAGLLAPAFGLWGIYKGVSLYRRGSGWYSKAAGLAVTALSAGGMLYGASRGLDFTNRLIEAHKTYRALSGENANIPSFSLSG